MWSYFNHGWNVIWTSFEYLKVSPPFSFFWVNSNGLLKWNQSFYLALYFIEEGSGGIFLENLFFNSEYLWQTPEVQSI